MISGGNVRIVMVTCASLIEGRRIAKSLVRKRLAACVSIVLGPVQSIYRWKDKIETAREHILLIKTYEKFLTKLEQEVLRWHSYEVPEFLVLPVAAGSKSYLDWLSGSLK
ncbi:MAG TPA: divalent-cation tolerance protein CutA [Terriglobales bacterium]|nr:divalent-cation tolerance protein CutA [Terriglobales bacterium]